MNLDRIAEQRRQEQIDRENLAVQSPEDPDAKKIPHGTRSGYVHHKCRCGPCVHVQKADDKRRYQLRKQREASK